MIDKLLHILEIWCGTFVALVVICFVSYVVIGLCWHFPYIAFPVLTITGLATYIQYKYEIGLFR
jgi:hypothetical protein